MKDLEDLRRDLAADPGNQSLRAAVSRAEARSGMKGRGFRLFATGTAGFKRSSSRRHARKHRSKAAFFGRSFCRRQLWTEPKFVDPEWFVITADEVDCKQCRSALGLGQEVGS